jgi:hypothetical protein
MLHDSVAGVRHEAAKLIAGYRNGEALAALRQVVTDPDETVSEQATIAVGWIGQSAAVGSDTRRQAIDVLRIVAKSGSARAAEQAQHWLSTVGAQ